LAEPVLASPTITVAMIPSDSVGFTVIYDGEPVEGAEVSLVTKGITPLKFTKITDSGGNVTWSYMELGVHQPGIFHEIPWLSLAYFPESEYGFWEDNVKLELGSSYEIELNRFTEVPIFFVEIKLRDLVGVELFSKFVAGVETAALEHAGLTVTEVTGAGTTKVRVYFQPPWTEVGPEVQGIWGPAATPIIAISWLPTVRFILSVTAVAVVIMAIVYVISWGFGSIVDRPISWAIVAVAGVAVVTGLVAATKKKGS